MKSMDEKDLIKKSGRKAKNWVIGSLIAILALAVLGTAMANTIMAKVAPDKYVLLSILQTNKLIKTSYPTNRKISFSFNVKTIDGIKDTYLEDLIEGSGISLSIANSAAGDILIDTTLSKSGINLMDISVYSSSDTLGIKIPGLLDQYLVIDPNQFKSQYDQSGFSSYMGDISQDEVDIFNQSLAQIRNAINNQFLGTNSQFDQDLNQLLITLGKRATIEHAGKTKLMINNKSKSTNQFSIRMDSKDVKHFLNDITKSALANTELIKTMSTFDLNYSKDKLEEIILNGLDQIKVSDIEIICSIDNNHHIVHTDFSTTLDIDEDKIKIHSDYTLSGSFKAEDLKDQNIAISDKQQLDLFSIGASEMISIANRISAQFYDVNNLLNYIDY